MHAVYESPILIIKMCPVSRAVDRGSKGSKIDGDPGHGGASKV